MMKLLLLAAAVAGSSHAHNVDVAFVASPLLVAEQGIEAVNEKAESWVRKANQTMEENGFAVTYTIKTIAIGDGSLPEDVITASAYEIGEQLNILATTSDFGRKKDTRKISFKSTFKALFAHL